MRALGFNIVFGVGVLALLILFQNCSLYKSKDRENYEKQGPPQVRGSQKATPQTLGQPVLNNCRSHLDEPTVRAVLGRDVVFTLFFDAEKDQFTCRITPPSVAAQAPLHYDCRILHEKPEDLDQTLASSDTVWVHHRQIHVAAHKTELNRSDLLVDFYAFSEGKSEIVYCRVNSQHKVLNSGLELAYHLRTLLN